MPPHFAARLLTCPPTSRNTRRGDDFTLVSSNAPPFPLRREGGRPVSTIALPGGDEAKSWSHLEKLVNWAFDTGQAPQQQKEIRAIDCQCPALPHWIHYGCHCVARQVRPSGRCASALAGARC